MWAMVLAGGASRRMGQPKHGLPFGDAGTLLEVVVRAARRFADEVVLVGDQTEAARLGLEAADDWRPGCGPLSALAGGLAACPEGRHALLACDMPFVEAELMRRMQSLGGRADAVVPLVEERRHPLMALYHTRCLAPATELLVEGKRRMDDLLERVDVCTVTREQVLPLDLARAVTNINTPADYQRAVEAKSNDGR